MGKGKGWRVFRWVDVLRLGAWLGTCPVPGAQAQPPAFDSLQVGSTWWWGDLDQWTLDGEVVFQDETWVWEGRATWSWDGTSSDGNFVPPGTYVAWAQALVDGARQSVEKCLVAVRGR